MIIIEITKSLNSNRKLSKLRDVIKKKVLKYRDEEREDIAFIYRSK